MYLEKRETFSVVDQDPDGAETFSRIPDLEKSIQIWIAPDPK
jgi:hypothetical protein